MDHVVNFLNRWSFSRNIFYFPNYDIITIIIRSSYQAWNMQYWIQAHFSLFRAAWIRYPSLAHLPISICGLPLFLVHSLGFQHHCIPPFILLSGIVPGEILFQFCYLLDQIWTRFLAVHFSYYPIVVCQHTLISGPLLFCLYVFSYTTATLSY